MNAKYILYIVLCFILSLNVFSASVWVNFGNTGYFAPGYDGYNFASGYLPGNYNYTTSSQAIPSAYQPIVYRPLDDTDNIQNYIYTFTTSGINVYQANNFALVTSLSVNNICGQPKLINFGSDSDVEIVFFTGNASYKNMTIVQMNGSVLSKSDFVSFPKNNTCVIDTDVANGFLATINENGTVSYFDTTSLTLGEYATGLSFPSSEQYNTAYPYYSNPLVVTDIDSDDNMDIYVVHGIAAGSNHYEFMRVEIDSTTGTATAGTRQDFEKYQTEIQLSLKLSVVQFGGISGQKEILFHGEDIDTTSFGNDNEMILILDKDLSPLIAINENNGYYFNSEPTIADINYDNSNEICWLHNYYDTGIWNRTKLYCLDSLNNSVYYINNSEFSLVEYNFIAFGEYDGVYTTMELITPNGLWRLDDYNTASKLYNFTYTDNNSVIYPVSLRNRLNFTKDILIYKSTTMTAYYSYGVDVSCGDLICSSGESIVTCPADCTPAVVGIIPTFEQCTENINCTTNNCVNGRCELVRETGACSSDSQCLSGDCNALGKCSRESSADNFKNGVKSIFGGDEDSLNLFSFILIVVIVIIVCAVLLIYAKDVSAVVIVIVAIAVINLGTFLLTSLGLMSGWFGFLILIIDVLSIIAFIFLNGNMSGR